ncbi:MAG: lysophospholipid acyltransferase family protein [Chloroflexi bacterium]|nr:lysophospholipid acyltransferase family protein [Chloroflexota bacterium]
MWKYILFQIVLHSLAYLPTRPLYRFVEFVADMVYLTFPRIRRNVWDNMRHVLGPDAPESEVRKAARQVFRNVAKYYADLIRLPHMDLDDFYDRRLTYHGFDENVLPAIKPGKGVILISGHFGNPELAVQGILPRGVKAFALTEPLSPPRLSRLVDALRSYHGHAFVPVNMANVKAAVRIIRSGGVVALMCDRDIEGPKALLPFFGEETYMPTGPIEVAIRTGATVIPVFCYRREFDKIEAFLEKPLEMDLSGDMKHNVRASAIRFLERFEKHLRQDPGQWIVFESIWDAKERAGREPVAARSKAA